MKVKVCDFCGSKIDFLDQVVGESITISKNGENFDVCDKCRKSINNWIAIGNCKVGTNVPEQPSIPKMPKRKKRKKSGWIPVSERLPERDVDVLTYHRNESFCYYYVSWIDDYSGKWTGFIGSLPDEVLAWMPLPEPYQEEKE